MKNPNMDPATPISGLTTALHRNPFFLLGVTPRDNRLKIAEQAEERAFHLDPSACQKARADLTHPRLRLAVELGWFPGVPPDRVAALLDQLPGAPRATALQPGLPDLARANLMAAALEIVAPAAHDASACADLMRLLAETVARLDPAVLWSAINEDRASAGFPQVRDEAVVAEDLDTLRKHYKEVLKAALGAMPADRQVDTMTLLVESSTAAGTRPAPPLVDDLADSYAVQAQETLDRVEQILSSLVDHVRIAALAGAKHVGPVLDNLELEARRWARTAQPIQVSMRARGMAHRKSRVLACQLRDLSVDLFNEHDLLDHAQRMTTLLRELFAGVEDVAEQLAADAQALQRIARKKSHAATLAPLRARCQQAARAANEAPAQADREAASLADLAPGQLAALEQSGVHADVVAEMSDEYAQAIAHCAVAFMNRTEQWSRSAELLGRASRFARDPKTVAGIAKTLDGAKERAERHGVPLPPIDNLRPGSAGPASSPWNQPTTHDSAWLKWLVICCALALVGWRLMRKEPPPVEARPAIGADLKFSDDQIRYCLAQKIRIESWEAAIKTRARAAVDAYNAGVEDFNARCGHFKYRRNAFEAVRAEVDGRRRQLQQEGAALAGPPR